MRVRHGKQSTTTMHLVHRPLHLAVVLCVNVSRYNALSCRRRPLFCPRNDRFAESLQYVTQVVSLFSSTFNYSNTCLCNDKVLSETIWL